MFGAWPFKTLFKNDIMAGLAMLVSCYIINLLLFRLFFDYGFMQGAPVYVASLDPHGMFQALNALGGEGWELMERQTSGTTSIQGFDPARGGPVRGSAPNAPTTWLFKRRVQ